MSIDTDIDLAEKELAAVQARIKNLWQEKVARDNARFADATPEERRIIIARDVIAQLQAGTIDAEQGIYLEFKGKPEAGGKCTACALGSVFACAITKPGVTVNQELVTDDPDAQDLRWALEPYFDEEQLRLIETAFEMDDFAVRTPRDMRDAAIEFGERYSSDQTRLIKIMENLIKNNGTFRPDLDLDYGVE